MLINRFAVTIDGRTRAVEIEDVDVLDGGQAGQTDGKPGGKGDLDGKAAGGGKLRVRVDGRERVLDVRALGGGAWSLLDGNDARLIQIDGALDKLAIEVSHPDGEPRACTAAVADARALGAAGGAAAGGSAVAGPLAVRAPIPGKLVKLLVKVGDRVAVGQSLAVLEAMKMENELRAPRAGDVVAVLAKEGAAVESGQELLTLG